MKFFVLFALAAGLFFPMGPMKPEPQNTTKQQIAAKWKAYEEAEKADRPQLQAELLQNIRDLAIQEHIPIDFYNASVRYITVKERRNWKDRDSVRREFSRLVRAFDEPIVTYKWMRNYGNYRTDRLLEYIQEDELVEITPNHMRMRKIMLDPLDRKRNSGGED